VIVPPHVPPVNTPSVPDTLPFGSQLSVYARFVMAGTFPMQSTVILAGGAEKTGSVTSLIIMVSVLVIELPQSSVIV